MFRCWWWTPVSGHILEHRSQDVIYAVLYRKVFAVRKWDPCSCIARLSAPDRPCMFKSLRTLIFSIPSLHLLVDAFLHFSLENSCPRRLVIVGHFQDVGRIDPVVGAAAHDMVGTDGVFVDWNLRSYQHLQCLCSA